MMYRKVNYQRRHLTIIFKLPLRVITISSTPAAGISRPSITWGLRRVKTPAAPSLRGDTPSWRLTGLSMGRWEAVLAVLAVVTVVLQGATWLGPGHGSVLQTGGAWWMFYHAWSSDTMASQQPGRQLLLDRSISPIYCLLQKLEVQSKSSGSTGEEAGPSWAYPVSIRDLLLSSPSLDILSVTKNVF